MAKNKKPRHAHRVKNAIPLSVLTKRSIDEMKSIFTRVDFLVEMKLGTGTCTEDDVSCIRDCFNLATASFVARKGLDTESIAEFSDEFNASKLALQGLIKRGKAIGRYVCTGDELTLIKNAMITVGEFINWSIDHAPLHLIKEWRAVHILTQEGIRHGKKSVSTEEIQSFLGSKNDIK